VAGITDRESQRCHVPVRIIFRGLVLFKVEEEKDHPGKGRILAKLIDAPHSSGGTPGGEHEMHGVPATPSMSAASGALHPEFHRHESEIHIFSRIATPTGEEDRVELEMLNRGETVEITPLPDDNEDYVARAESYDDFCPRLSDIIDGATDGRTFGRPSDTRRMESFVRNTVVMNRGTIRVREIVSWDGGAFPLPNDASSGVAIEVPAKVKFLASLVRGHMASECMIDIPNATGVKIGGTLVKPPKGDRHAGRNGSLRIPPKTVEILVTNFPPQRGKAVPWSTHFGWFFEAAGYTPGDLQGDEFTRFKELFKDYDPLALADDLRLIDDGRRGFPFPYIESLSSKIELTPVRVAQEQHDPWNRPLCPQGDE
jgi:hypothetical protein